MLLQLEEPTSRISAIGIDLGTTHTLMAVSIDENPRVLEYQGDFLIPSSVTHHDETFRSFKRFMHSPNQPLSSHIPQATPIQLSAHILKALKKEAENQLGYPVDQAVITVPAYFDDTARQATRDAASQAGWTVLRLISEPTAAARAYNLNGFFAVYDLGGGTFDLSLVRIDKGVYHVIGTVGDTALGGDDIDEAICHFWGQPLSTDTLLLARQAKEFLSHSSVWSQGGYTLTRDDLISLSTPIINKTLSLCQKALKDAEITQKDLDGVILVGGSTRLFGLQEAIQDFFNLPLFSTIDPDKVVALGAALQAEALTRGSESLILDVTPLSLGLETMGGIVERLIPRNHPIPARVTQEFTTFHDNQTAISIHVVQGESDRVSECLSLATFIFEGIPEKPAGQARLAITFHLDANGILHVSAKEPDTGTSQEMTIIPSVALP